MSYQLPGRSDVHVDVPLTNISVAFMQDNNAFVADRVFPIVPVEKQTNKYFTIPRGAFFRDGMEVRAAGAEPALANYQMSTDNYAADVYALAKDLADQVRSNYDSPLQPDREVTEFLTLQALIHKERLWASNYFGTSKWTLDQTGVNNASPGANQFGMWDRADSNPIEVIRKGRRIVQARTGYKPNKMVLGREVFDALLDHPDIVGRIDRGQTSGPAQVMLQNLAALFELDEILVMDAVYNSANEGAADSIGFIGGKSALLLYVPPAAGLMVPSAGYTFSWTGLLGTSGVGPRIKKLRLEWKEADRVEIQMAYAHKIVSADLGLFYATAVS